MVRSGDVGGHAIRKPPPSHLSGSVSFKSCTTSSITWRREPSWWRKTVSSLQSACGTANCWTMSR